MDHGGLAVHERHVKKRALLRRQSLVGADMHGFLRQAQRQRVGCEAARVVPIDVAGKLIQYNDLRQSADNLNQLLAGINQGKGAIGLMAKDPKFAQKLNDTVTNLNTILNNINQGEGTIGQLAKNPALYHHVDDLMTNSNKLIDAFRQNPKKYLTIQLKIF